MTTNPNRFFHGLSHNTGNNRSHFLHYIIETVHDLSDYNGDTILERVSRIEDYYIHDDRIDEPYYIVYGVLKSESTSKLIASFDNLSQAIDLVENLTGNKVIESDLPIYRAKHEH